MISKCQSASKLHHLVSASSQADTEPLLTSVGLFGGHEHASAVSTPSDPNTFSNIFIQFDTENFCTGKKNKTESATGRLVRACHYQYPEVGAIIPVSITSVDVASGALDSRTCVKH